MSGSNYTAGYQSEVWYAPMPGGVVGTYTKLSQTKDIKGPDSSVGEIKLTNNDSPNNSRESAPGLIEPGTIGWDMVYTDSMYNTLMTMFGDGAVYSWKEVFKDGSTIIGPGYLQKAPLTAKTEDEAIMVSVEVKLTSKADFTPGS